MEKQKLTNEQQSKINEITSHFKPKKLSGFELIAIERKRQVEELGYDYSNDELYSNNELAQAGIYYALRHDDREELDALMSGNWPWDQKYWKPTPKDRVRELVKAGALIAAQIDYELNKLKQNEKDIEK